MDTRAAFISGAILSELTGIRYWSYRVAITLPSLSVTVLTVGSFPEIAVGVILATESPTSAAVAPNPRVTGASTPASNVPPRTQPPTSFAKFPITRTLPDHTGGTVSYA